MKYNILMELVCELGSRLATVGAETYRVEESVRRILSAYGLESRVYCVPNSLIVTILVPDGTPITQLCRMGHHGNDLDAVEHYSNLSRRICAQKPDPDEALQWLNQEEQNRKHYPLLMDLLGHILVSAGFCIFFGGSLADSLCAALCGLLLGLFNRLMPRIKTNTFFETIAASFLIVLTAYGFAALGFCDNADTSIIGTLMLLVPGLLFTNALRDIIFGDTTSGINRIVEVLMIAAAIALGTAAASNLANSLWAVPAFSAPIDHHSLTTCATALIACTGFVLVFNIHGYGNLLCALGGGVSWAAYCIVLYFGGSIWLCFFIATVVASIYSEVMARIRKYPAISYLVISLLPLIPGSGIFYTAQQVVQGNMTGFAQQGTQTLAIAGIIAVGILVVSTAVRILFSHPKKSPVFMK